VRSRGVVEGFKVKLELLVYWYRVVKVKVKTGVKFMFMIVRLIAALGIVEMSDGDSDIDSPALSNSM
jgi:hypothetical protein